MRNPYFSLSAKADNLRNLLDLSPTGELEPLGMGPTEPRRKLTSEEEFNMGQQMADYLRAKKLYEDSGF